jgi:hypothetical protein
MRLLKITILVPVSSDNKKSLTSIPTNIIQSINNFDACGIFVYLACISTLHKNKSSIMEEESLIKHFSFKPKKFKESLDYLINKNLISVEYR